MARRAAVLALFLLLGCASQPAGTAAIVDPTVRRDDFGTLVDISDVIEVSERMASSLRGHPSIQDLLRAGAPVRILAEAREIKNLTSMAQFNKRLFLSRLLSNLNRAAGEDFRFLDREAVRAERERQLAGEVRSAGLDETPAGADLVLAGRILEMLDRRPAAGGSVEETRSVQFSFSLVRVKDGTTLWTDSFFRVKQQVIGTVYS